MTKPSLAFILVALCYLLPEADYWVRQLDLPCPSPLERTNLVEIRITGGKERLLGLVSTTNYLFAFEEYGRVHRLEKRKQAGWELHMREDAERLARQYSPIDTNGAYGVALERLASVGVDVGKLNEKYAHRILFPTTDAPVRVVTPSGKGFRTRIVPHFWVSWLQATTKKGMDGVPAAEVELLGPTGELLQLSLQDHACTTRPAVTVPGQAVLQELPDSAFSELWSNRSSSVSNVFSILRTSTAYQKDMLARMLREADWAFTQLGIPSGKHIRIEYLTDSLVTPPCFGFRGIIADKDSCVQFDKQGKVEYIFHVPHSSYVPSSSKEFYNQMSLRPMLVDSNSVVELAVGWLRALQFDVDKLNRVAKPIASRYLYSGNKPSHLWWITWWDPSGSGSQVLWVEVDGTTKNPDRIRLADSSYSLRPGIGPPNAEELMGVPDKSTQRDPLMAHLNIRGP